MTAEFFDRQDRSNALNGARIENTEELSKILDDLRNREPFFCELVGENGFKILLGVGRTIGCVQYSPADGSTPYLMAVGTNEQDSHGYMEFFIADTPTPVPRRYCLGLEMAKQIAGYFVETGGRSPTVSWEEI